MEGRSFAASAAAGGRLSGSISPEVISRADEYQAEFDGAKPFKYCVIENFLEASFADELLRDFPVFDPEKARNEFGEIGGKAVHEGISQISDTYAKFFSMLGSGEFLAFMTRLTSIPGLMNDPKMYGGGTHENRHGQELDAHIDFNYDPPTKLHRRLNLLVYLNKEWLPEWGGQIELHSNPRRPDENQVFAFEPLFNRALIFETNEISWHGFPRIDLPEDKRHLSRKSLSIYFYTKDRPEHEKVPEHGTFYVQRWLPPHIQAGHVLTDADVQSIRELLARRDSWIEKYQRDELINSSRFGDLHSEIATLRDSSTLIRIGRVALQRLGL